MLNCGRRVNGDAASQSGAERNFMDAKEKKTGGDPEIIPAENPGQTTDDAIPTLATEQTDDGVKQTIDLDIVSKTVENRQYHPGFVTACHLTWNPKKYNLEFYNEL